MKSTRARGDTTARAGGKKPSPFARASNEDRQAKCDLALAINISLYRFGGTQLLRQRANKTVANLARLF